jgi:DNA primase
MTHPIRRSQFAEDAANKLAIDSALMRQQLKQAAAQRIASITAQLSDLEPDSVQRVLLRALVQAEDNPDRILAAKQLLHHPEWYEGLAAHALFDALVQAPCPPDPLDVVSDDRSRTMLANSLNLARQEADEQSLSSPTIRAAMAAQVDGALHKLEQRYLERRQRELRSQIAEADRRGDQALLSQLIADKLAIDRTLRNH